jgi:hypothetical protein
LDEAQVDAGADFEQDILSFLERADELVVLLTPRALDRPYVWAEIGAAISTASAAERSMTAMKKPTVFISHSQHDADWARKFAQALKQRGVSVWFDEFDVRPGESMPDALESGLRSSDVIVAVLDSEGPATPNLFFELGASISMGKEFVSIVPKGLDPSNLPFEVRLRRYLIGDNPEHTAEELSNSLLAA